MSERIVTYEPDNSIKKGYFAMFTEIFSEIKRNRWLTWQIFKRDFFGAYKQSIVGLLWIFIVPIVSVATFILLNGAGIFSFGTITVPYPIYAVMGIALWQLFAAGVVGCGGSLVGAGGLLTQINFSKKSLALASMAKAIVSFLILMALITALFIYYLFTPHWGILLLPVFIVPLILLALGLGFVLAIFNSIVRDVGTAMTMMLSFFMFLTPVLYARPTGGLLGALTKYNPLYYLVAVPRDFMLTGVFSHWLGYAVSLAIALVAFFAGLIVFHQTETRITERI